MLIEGRQKSECDGTNHFAFKETNCKPTGCLNQVANVGGFLLVEGLAVAIHGDASLNSSQRQLRIK